MVAAIGSPVDAVAADAARAFEFPATTDLAGGTYLVIEMTVRAVVSPKSALWMIAVTDAWRPGVAPFGIDVVNVAVPAVEVVSALDAITGTPGTARVNVTVAPFRARPSGSVTTTVRVTGSGSAFARTE